MLWYIVCGNLNVLNIYSLENYSEYTESNCAVTPLN